MRKLDELQLWLEGKEAAQVNWRLDPKNLAQVSELVSQYANTIGGKSSSQMWSRIEREKQIAAQIIEAADREKREREILVEAVRSDYLKNGGLEADFKARQASILESYAVSGRSREILDRAERERRSKSARTF